MQTTMMDIPLSLNHILDRAGRLFPRSEIVTRLPDKSLRRHTYAQYYQRTRSLAAGTLIGAGTISNADAASGNACITEARVRASLAGVPDAELVPYLRHGDRVRIEALDARGRSVFGAIDQRVEIVGAGR